MIAPYGGSAAAPMIGQLEEQMPFSFERTPFEGLVIVRIKCFADSRGSFCELFKGCDFKEAGIAASFCQDNLSRSRRGVVRGMHYQARPHAQAKLVCCLQGRILDAATDLRQGSPTFLKTFMAELSPENGRALFIPAGFAHGFAALEESLVLYKAAGAYCPQAERGFRYDDPRAGIPWNLPFEPILSEKDAARGAIDLSLVAKEA